MKYFHSLIPLALLAPFACNGAPDSEPSDGLGGNLGGMGGTSAVDSISKVLGKEGGTIAIDGAVLEFPPGALAGDQEIRLTRLEEAEVSPLPAGAAFASPPVAFEPHGLAFDAPVAVTLDYEPGTGKRFVVPKLDDHGDDTWEKGADAEFEDGKATFTISSFSIWDVVEDPDGAFDAVAPVDPPTGPGSFSTRRLSGVVSLLDPEGVVQTSNVTTATGLPYCAAGSLGTSVPAGLSFDLGQSATSSADADFTPAGDGLRVALDPFLGFGAQIRLETAEADYCASYQSWDPIPWSNFYDCAGSTPYDGSPIDAIHVEMLSGEGSDFYFCVTELDEEYYGYFETADFYGFASRVELGAGSVSSGPEDLSASSGICVTGASAESTDDAFGLSVNLKQTVDGEIDAVMPTSDGLDLTISSSDMTMAGDLRAEIVSDSGSWCALIPEDFVQLTWGTFFIDWDDFSVNCDGTGGSYAGQGIETLRILVDGPSTFSSLCLEDLGDIAAPRVGYFQSNLWHGYPEATFVGTGLSATDDNLDWVRTENRACIEGTAAAGATGYAELLVPLNQSTPGGAQDVVTLTQSAIQFQATISASFDPQTAILVDENDQYFCAVFSPSGVPLNTFWDCATSAIQFSGTSIKALGLRIGSDATSPNTFDVCLNALYEL